METHTSLFSRWECPGSSGPGVRRRSRKTRVAHKKTPVLSQIAPPPTLFFPHPPPPPAHFVLQ